MDGIKVLFAIALLFLVSLFQSCTEMRLSLFGVRDQATIGSVTMEVEKATLKETGRYAVNYHFRAKDGDAMREISGDLSVSRAEAEKWSTEERIDLVYLPSNPSINRVAGHREWWWIALFFLFLTIGVVYAIRLYRQAMVDLGRSRR